MPLILEKAIEYTGKSTKELARLLHYDEQMIYKARKGTRNLSPEALRALSKISLGAGLEISSKLTNYEFFRIRQGDRHIQTLIRWVEKEDSEADRVIERLPWILLDKEAEGLTDADIEALKEAQKEIAERVNADLNLLVEIEVLLIKAKEKARETSGNYHGRF